jgi:hypothetical protein
VIGAGLIDREVSAPQGAAELAGNHHGGHVEQRAFGIERRFVQALEQRSDPGDGIGEDLRLRARLISRDEYFLDDTGSPQAIAIVKLAVSCFLLSLGFYLFLNLGQLISGLKDSAGPALDPTIEKQSSAELIWNYLTTYTVWSFVPACCGVMTAWAVGRSDEVVRVEAGAGDDLVLRPEAGEWEDAGEGQRRDHEAPPGDR